jgi:2-polyprenyl-3-methyl-5-hydroxy-6-metoxy-1,4-benzoquinol methylase
VQCLDCAIIYTKPTLIPESNPYASETSEEYFQLHDAKQKTENGKSLAMFAENVLGFKGKMLELGCGRGELLAGAAKCGWDVYGVEMTKDFARAAGANGVNVEWSSIQYCESLNHPETYDVILLAAVLEHLYDPHETLMRINRALRHGGLLFIDVPNELSLTMRIGNWYMRARGRDWAINLSPTFSPFHVVGFSPVSLKNALELTGFRVHKFDICKWHNDLPRGSSFVEKIERLSLGTVQSVGSSLGMGDGITCWAVRQ